MKAGAVNAFLQRHMSEPADKLCTALNSELLSKTYLLPQIQSLDWGEVAALDAQEAHGKRAHLLLRSVPSHPRAEPSI